MTAAAAETALAPADPPSPTGAGPQFARGFDGMATEPFPEAARRVLAEPVNDHDVEIKPDGIVFLPGVAYRRILTRAFGAGGWAIAPRSPARYMKDNNIVVYHGALFCLGRFVAEAVGECFYRDNNPNMSYASCVEGAKTDALSRCCKDLGIATEMWDANWREQWKAKFAVSYKNNEGKTKWKLKSRVSNPHDLMAGAGGVAPPTQTTAAASTAAPKTSATVPAATRRTGEGQGSAPKEPGTGASDRSDRAASGSETGTSAGARSERTPEATTASTTSGGTASEPGTVSPPADTGEAATTEQKDALRTHIRAKKWTRAFVKLWFKQLFGAVVAVDDPLEALTQRQADAAFTLLLAHGTSNYDKLRAELVGEGTVTE